MPLFLQHIETDFRWGIWKVEESEEELLACFSDSKQYAEELSKLKSPHRRIEWLAVRVLLQTLSGEEKMVGYYDNGRPYLLDGSCSLSISHTKGYVAVLLSSKQQLVGIDIEQTGERVRKVAHKFIGPSEQISLYNDSDIWSLLLHWSAKESMFKCMDTPEVDFIHHLHIHPFQVQSSGTFQAHETRTPSVREYNVHYLLHPDFVLTYIYIKPSCSLG